MTAQKSGSHCREHGCESIRKTMHLKRYHYRQINQHTHHTRRKLINGSQLSAAKAMYSVHKIQAPT